MARDFDSALTILRAAFRIGQCPACAADTATSNDGHPRLCLRCTEREIGISARENSARIECGMTVAAFLKRAPDDPLPTSRANATKRKMFGTYGRRG